MPEPPSGGEQKKLVAVLYCATIQPERVIAEYLAAGFQARGLTAELRGLDTAADLDLGRCAAAVIVAGSRLEPGDNGLLDFVRAKRGFLERMPVAFISMSGAGEDGGSGGKGSERGDGSTERSRQFVADTRTILDRLFSETGWRPTRHWPIAGAVTYVRYGFFVRVILKLLLWAGATPGRSREDWRALDAFLDEFEEELRAVRPEGPTQPGAAAGT